MPIGKKRGDWWKWLALTMISLPLLFASCVTCPPTVTTELDWPDFPDPTGEVTMEDGVVSMSLDYWMAIAAYAVAVQRVRDIVGEEIER